MKYVPRLLERKILDHIKGDTPPYNCILLGGARQCGKSTLLKHLFPEKEHIHINFALEGGLCETIDATKDFEEFTILLENRLHYRMGSGRVIIFDEAQLSSELGRYVRFMKEIWQNQHVILTGSTLSNLFDRHEKPTGRVFEFTLRPFNFMEFLDALEKETLLEKLKIWSPEHPLSQIIHKELIDLLEIYLKIGGLPEVVLTYKEGKDFLLLLANIFAFYKRDFQDKLSSENLTSLFSQVFLRIAAATGSPITISSIIKSSSPGYRKVPAVLSILENWHQIIRVDCETSKLSKVGTTTPKRYLFDHGIRTLQNPSRWSGLNLLDITSLAREEVGGLVENFVLTEILSLGLPLPVRSWGKTHQAGWIDFVFQTSKKHYALEVKASPKFDKKHLSPLLTYKKFYPESSLMLANLSPGGIETVSQHKIVILPAYAVYPFTEKNSL